MRRAQFIAVLLAGLLASGAQWDLLQSFAWGRMIVGYSRTMPLREAVRLTFTPDNLCGVCEFVAQGKTRDADDTSSNGAPTEAGSKAKTPLALPPAHFFVFYAPTGPHWPRERSEPDARSRPAPPTEPPRAA